MRRVLSIVAAVVALTAATARGQDEPAASPSSAAAPVRGRRAALANELALYSPFESPWAEVRGNHAFESRLFSLLRAEARLWDLQDALAAQDGPAREEAADIARILHAQVLAETAEALPLLQKTPNKAFALLLVHQLEAYPSEWKEEGSEELLPSLHKLIDPPAGKPAAENNGRRRRKRATVPATGDAPAASPSASP